MPSVLVVDDAQFMRIRVRNLLEEQGYEVIEAKDGAEAVKFYAIHHPDLVLMDITMPVMDGLTALKAIREQYPDAKIVMCSALGQESTVIQAIKAGAKDFIVKPFQPEKILAAVRKQVG